MYQSEYLQQALELYPLNQATPELIRHNENMTYRIIDASKRYVLRIHKPIAGFTNASFPTNLRRNAVGIFEGTNSKK